MGRLLIDYSKNTAPLQPSGGGDQEVGMSLRYHVPDEEMSSSIRSLVDLMPPRSPRQQGTRAVYPLQKASVFDSRQMPGPDFQLQNSKSKRAQRSSSPRRRRGRNSIAANNDNNAMITFRLPKTPRAVRTGSRFKDKLHYSDGDLLLDDGSTSNQTTTTKAAAKRTTEDDLSLSVCTAPAKVTCTKNTNNSNNNKSAMSNSSSKSMGGSSKTRSSVRTSIREEGERGIDALLEEEEAEEEGQGQLSSFLPLALSSSAETADRNPLPPSSKKKKKVKKKKNKTTLDEYFGNNKGGMSQDDLDLDTDNHKETTKKSLTRHQNNREEDDVSLALSQMSESYPMGPAARRRMLPKRTLSFEDSGRHAAEGSLRSLVSASTNTRRGGRRPGNRNKDDDATVETTSSRLKSSRRGLPSRTKSFDGSISTSMSNSRGDLMKGNSSFSFMAGSRIRVRTPGPRRGSNNSLLGSKGGSNNSLLGSMSLDDDESVVSQSPSPRSRRGLPIRSKTCDSLRKMRVL